ncbi:response regulator [Albibacterium indicum]|uniref:response regulator n=1 Tax=Albibacterium indicum TaxID=2292082 RepID=UPI000E4E0215|nr:response regulator [Pedobacter indicus]
MNKSNKTILVIEDHDDIRESIVEILEMADYQVISAADGKSGFELALKHIPDLILCDIMMPILDGYGVLYLLGKHEETSKIPLIFLTAKAERTDVRKAMEMGADDYLTKPFDDIELLNAVESRLKKRRSHGVVSNIIPQDVETFFEELSEAGKTRKYKKKQLIYQESDSPLYLYRVNKGTLRSFLFYDVGRELTIGIFTKGDFFGYDTILTDSKYYENVETLEDCELTLINKSDLQDLVTKRPTLNAKFIHLLASNNQLKSEKLLSLAYGTVRKRIAEALVFYTEKLSGTHENDTYKIRVLRDDLASMAGTANETVSRILADFKDENLITKEGNSIHVLDIQGLKKVT